MIDIDSYDRDKVYESAVGVIESGLEFEWEARVYKDYSGRGMYGRTCTGIVTTAPAAIVGAAIVAAAMDNLLEGDSIRDSEDVKELFCLIPTRSDNLGLDMIYY